MLPIRSVILDVSVLWDNALVSNDFNRIQHTVKLCHAVRPVDFPKIRSITVNFPRWANPNTYNNLYQAICCLTDIRSLEELILERSEDMSIDAADSESDFTDLDVEERDRDLFADEALKNLDEDYEDPQAKLLRIERIRFEDRANEYVRLPKQGRSNTME